MDENKGCWREPRYANYTVNSLNQYTQRTVPGYTAVMGTAHSHAVVTLVDSAGNSARALRQQDHFFGELPVTNYLGPVWLGITNYAVLDTETEQVFTNSSGAVLIAPTPQVYSHDDNGNLTSDGLWVRTWNAENRMTRVESAAGVPVQARKREDWTYLPDGRWIERIVSTNNGSAYYPAFTNRFVWDGKVLLAILDNNNQPIMTFLRGADLSGTIEGAGGVGGVLAVSFYGSEPSTHFLSYDGNGNVIALTDAATAETTAVFEYGPFGELLRATGPMADQMPLRFSTMYADDVTGDVKYLYRDLSLERRWTSRDPMEERGGINLYGFVINSPVSTTDAFGLEVTYLAEGRYFFDGSWTLGGGPPGIPGVFGAGFVSIGHESGHQPTTAASFDQLATVEEAGVLLCNSTLQSANANHPSSFIVAKVENKGKCSVRLTCKCTVTYSVSQWTKKGRALDVKGHVLGRSFSRTYPHVRSVVPRPESHTFIATGSETITEYLGFVLKRGEARELYYGSPQLAVPGTVPDEGFSEVFSGSCECDIR